MCSQTDRHLAQIARISEHVSTWQNIRMFLYMSYFKCFSVTVLTIYSFNPRLRLCLCEIGYSCTLMKMRTAVHSWFNPHDINSLFCIYFRHENQLTKRCCNTGKTRRSQGFLMISKIMKFINYQIAKKCHDFHHCCRWLHHYFSGGCHVWL